MSMSLTPDDKDMNARPPLMPGCPAIEDVSPNHGLEYHFATESAVSAVSAQTSFESAITAGREFMSIHPPSRTSSVPTTPSSGKGILMSGKGGGGYGETHDRQGKARMKALGWQTGPGPSSADLPLRSTSVQPHSLPAWLPSGSPCPTPSSLESWKTVEPIGGPP